MLSYLDFMGSKEAKKTGGYAGGPSGNVLVIQDLISPLDIYTYLKARFGGPNGFQTFIKEDDSDNLFHWDYYLKAGNRRLFFVGATQEVHVQTEDSFSDVEWLNLIDSLKKDFGRVGKAKREVLNKLEKWSIFPNHFLSLADQCAGLYEKLRGSLTALRSILPDGRVSIGKEGFEKLASKRSALNANITSAAIELSILTPVMFEAFIGLLIACLVKKEVHANERLYTTYVRGSLDVKIYDLHNRCMGFERPVDPNNAVMKRYWSAVNRQNDIIHGNVDPVKDAVDTVYFDGKTPLYRSGGDRIKSYWESLLRQHQPARVLEDYETAHEFIYEIANHLDRPTREAIYVMMAERQPGYDEKRRQLGKLFPNFVVDFSFEGLRYDRELLAP